MRHPSASKQAMGSWEEGVISLQSGPVFSLCPQLLHAPIYRLIQMPFSLEQGSYARGPVVGGAGLDCPVPPTHRGPAATQPGHWGATAEAGGCVAPPVQRRLSVIPFLPPLGASLHTKCNRPYFSESCEPRMRALREFDPRV